MSHDRILCTLFLLAALPAGGAVAQETPTGAAYLEPYAPMQVRQEAASLEMYEAALAAQNKLLTALTEYEKLVQENNAERVAPKALYNTYISTLDLQWYAKRLGFLGEPAGHDFVERRDHLAHRLSLIFGAVKRLPGTNAALTRLVAEVANIDRRNQKILKEVSGLMQQQKYIEADEALFPAIQQIFSASIWYNIPPPGPGDVKPYTSKYGAARENVSQPAEEARRAYAEEVILKLLGEATPDFEALRNQIKSAVSSVGNSGNINGQTGPQWLVEFGNQWNQAQIDAAHAIGLQMSRFSTNPQQAVTDLQAFIAAQHQFSADMTAEVANLISADGARVPPAEARDLYEAYLAAVAPLVALSSNQEFAAIFQPALDQLANRSPDLQIDVVAYRAATADLLRWRERVAASYVMAQAQGFANVSNAVYEAGRAPEVPEHRLFPPLGSGPDQQALLGGAGPVIVMALGSKLINQKVWASDFINSRSGSDQLTSSKVHSTYARLPMSIDLTPAVQDLQAALLAKDGFDPLSLEAAVALETARRGDLLTVGGTLTNLAIEGYSSRLTNADANDWGWLRLGKAPDADVKKGGVEDVYLPQVVVRATIEPQWWRHKYFYFQL